MEIAEAVATLTYFNEKADRLAGLSFTKHLRETDLSWSFEFNDQRFLMRDTTPSDEAIDAFILTLRFFIQDNEPISIGSMAGLYDSLPIEEHIEL